jgi:hypothetical protein
MNAAHWQRLFLSAARILGAGDPWPQRSPSWCSWTTFERLGRDAGYWASGLPAETDVFESYIGDGGVWGQPFAFSALAHLVIPREFYWESPPGQEFTCGTKLQDIERLSSALTTAEVPHRLTNLVLEVKCY